MDQRSQHSYPAAMPDGPAPWPQQAPALHAGAHHVGAPVAHSPQFQYDHGAVVVPGSSQHQPPPMTSHDGMIGMQSPVYGHVAHHGVGAPQQPAHVQLPGHAQFVAQAQQPQAWAYPTPNGMQLVQSGPTPTLVQDPSAAIGVGTTRRRVRWETIVPIVAVTCLVAAIGVFIMDFDAITGRDVPAAAQQTAVDPVAAPPTSTDPEPTRASPAAAMKQARALVAKGRFDAAARVLTPLTTGAAPNANAVKLRSKVTAAGARNRALLSQLSTHRRAGEWQAVITTIGKLQQVRPLSRDLVRMRSNARRAMRAQAARRAALKRADAASASSRTRGVSGPPPAGGQPPAATAASTPRPPANVPAGGIPTRPDLPNPTGGGGGAVGGGPATSKPPATKPAAAATQGNGDGGCTWMIMDGVSMCH